MKNLSLKDICIIALIGIGIGLIICLFSGGFSIGIVVLTTLAVLGIGLSGVEAPTILRSPEENSMLYKTDLGTGQVISELQKLNKDKPEAGIFESAEVNSVRYNTDLGTGKVISELQKLNKK